MKLPLLLLLCVLVSPLSAESSGLIDQFSSAEHPTRQALRGEWVFENGTAACVSDPELYKEFKNHGPILRWPCHLSDGVLEFEVMPEDCQRLVITFNADGHIFRITMRDDNQSRVIGWIGKSSKENKGDILTDKSPPQITAIDGKWTKVRLAMREGKGRLEIGDYVTELDHESLARLKTEFTISFASGSCAVRRVLIQPKGV